MRLKRTITFGLLGPGLSVLLAVSDAQSEISDRQRVQPLLPMMRIYLNLNICASVAHANNDTDQLQQLYGGEAVRLQADALSGGWSDEDLAVAMTDVVEEKSALRPLVRDDDTPETFNRRYYNREFCQEQVRQAQAGGFALPL